MQFSETNHEGRRNVYLVTNYILINIIPLDESLLREHLMKFQSDLFHQAPEVLYGSYLWKRLIYILNSQIKSIDQDWQKQLYSYLANDKQM